MNIRPEDESRFWEKVRKSDGCWTWTASGSPRGYGIFWCDRTRMQAHRFSWFILVGPIPNGMELDHKCRNRACVNPDHLRIVTHKENSLVNSLGVGAINKEKTRCPKGHPYDSRVKCGHGRSCRRCSTCHAEACRRHREKRRLEGE